MIRQSTLLGEDDTPFLRLSPGATRTAARLGPDGPAALRARLLAVVAVESRGDAAVDAPALPCPSIQQCGHPEAGRAALTGGLTRCSNVPVTVTVDPGGQQPCHPHVDGSARVTGLVRHCSRLPIFHTVMDFTMLPSPKSRRPRESCRNG